MDHGRHVGCGSRCPDRSRTSFPEVGVDPADGLELVGLLRPHRSGGRSEGQYRLHGREVGRLRLGIRGGGYPLVCGERQGGRVQPNQSHLRVRRMGALHPGAQPFPVGCQRGGFPRLGRLCARQGTEVRHPSDEGIAQNCGREEIARERHQRHHLRHDSQQRFRLHVVARQLQGGLPQARRTGVLQLVL